MGFPLSTTMVGNFLVSSLVTFRGKMSEWDLLVIALLFTSNEWELYMLMSIVVVCVSLKTATV